MPHTGILSYSLNDTTIAYHVDLHRVTELVGPDGASETNDGSAEQRYASHPVLVVPAKATEEETLAQAPKALEIGGRPVCAVGFEKPVPWGFESKIFYCQRIYYVDNNGYVGEVARDLSTWPPNEKSGNWAQTSKIFDEMVHEKNGKYGVISANVAAGQIKVLFVSSDVKDQFKVAYHNYMDPRPTWTVKSIGGGK